MLQRASACNMQILLIMQRAVKRNLLLLLQLRLTPRNMVHYHHYQYDVILDSLELHYIT
jgi:hypothetical protein